MENNVPEMKFAPGMSSGKVYRAINAIQKELSKTGITKGHSNAQQGYKFRGIDDVYNALSPLLAEHGLCILPRVLARTVSERKSNSGGALFSVCVEAEFDFVCSEDGSKHTVKTFGEAMDSGDKATNKALSAAYKYACIQAFAIPTEGENDADAVTHEVASPARQSAPAERPTGQAAAQGGSVISEPQGKRLFAMAMGAGKTKEALAGYLKNTYGISSTRELLRKDYEDACAWAEAKEEVIEDVAF